MEFNQAKQTTTERTETKNGSLVCPNCGHERMHQATVTTFSRDEEDAETGIKATVEGNNIRVDNTMEDNPSRRRDATEIDFLCEMGCDITLVISQNKGKENIYWK
jgi:uncharacterized Zn finger protein (UPF0148 family)